MREIARYMWRKGMGAIARAGVVWPFVWLYSRTIQQVTPKGGIVTGEVPTVLALNAERFRGDLEALADSGRLRVFKLSFDWQVRVLNLFWPESFRVRKDIYFNPVNDPGIASMQEDIRTFFRRFLPALYRRLGVDCVVGAAKHYLQDFDWGRVSDELGFPYIVLHRENLASAPKHYQAHFDRGKRLHHFRGSCMVVHNEVVRQALIDSGFVAEDRISALGCLRMDEYVRRVKRVSGELSREQNERRKKVVLFSFHHGMGLSNLVPNWPKDPNAGFQRLFEQVHVAFATLASQNPHVDFVIKPKWGGNWEEKIHEVLHGKGIEMGSIPNLQLIVDTDVHDLILGADVVCSFQSTTMLESAIAGKPVIVPYFGEALRPEYADYIHFREDFHLFDVAQSAEEFQPLILKRLQNPSIEERLMAERYRIFEKYVSSMEGNSLEKYVNAISRALDERSGGMDLASGR